METEEKGEAVLYYEYEVYYNYDKLYNLKISESKGGILFDITYGDFFIISSGMEHKIAQLFDKTKTGLRLYELPLAIWKSILLAKIISNF